MKKIIFIALVIVAFVGLFVLLSKKIVVGEVVCNNQFGPCTSEVSEMALAENGNNFFSAKQNLASKLSGSSRIDKYNIRFNLPSRLVVDVVEKKAEVAIKFSGERFFLFDREGNQVGEVPGTELPTLVAAGTPDDASVEFAVKLFYDLFIYYNVDSGVLEQFALSAEVKGVRVVFPLEGDIDVIFGSLEIALLQLNTSRENPTINGTAGNFDSIDLRYKNPVISTRH